MTSVRYKSTRGGEHGLCFEEVVLSGLGKDRGLYVPEHVPYFNPSEIEQVGVH
jgi:threonine synthase